MSTINEVARLSGSSVATVSRVINSSGPVAPETKKRILDAIEALGYNPNEAARNLRTNKSNIIIVILQSITNTFFSKVIRGIEETGRKHGYNVVLCPTGGNEDSERTYLKMIDSRQADGVIFMDSALRAKELREFGKSHPAVFCSEHVSDTNIPYISIDNAGAAYEMTKYLLSQGHKNIALVSERTTTSAMLREKGYKKAVTEAGQNPYIYYGNYSFNSGYDAAKEIISSGNNITAVFAISDIMALGVCRAFEDAGIDVPGKTVVSGFDNIFFSRVFKPELTTVAQPRYQLGENAMLTLIDSIKHRNKNISNIIMEHTLIKRNSTERRNNND